MLEVSLQQKEMDMLTQIHNGFSMRNLETVMVMVTYKDYNLCDSFRLHLTMPGYHNYINTTCHHLFVEYQRLIKLHPFCSFLIQHAVSVPQ